LFSVKFWGVRGSIPCPGPLTAKYGGNTSCLQIKTDQDYEVIIDMGTGVRNLGNALFKDPAVKKPLRLYIFLTHTHWDHIMGYPFFGPIYVKGSEIDIYGPVPLEENLETIVAGQLTYKYFPIRFEELQSTLQYHHLKEGSMELPGGLLVSFKYLNHPIMCLGYRFEYNGKSISTCYDHEPFSNLFENDSENAAEGALAAEEQNNFIADFYKHSDIFIHDSQYTSKEYTRYKGWGHSTIKYALEQALKAEVKKLVLFHHDPERKDAQLDIVNSLGKERFKNRDFEIIPAYEGLEISV
jgi:phosphoribosyl 1,2-cyclic phosphodiesterase